MAVTLLAAGCGGGGSDDTTTAEANSAAPLPDAVAADIDEGGQVTRAEALRRRRPPAPAPTPAPSPPPPAPAPAPASAGTTCGIANFEASILARVNQYRAAGASCRSAGTFGPAAALAWNTKLTQAAAGHSLDMASKNYFSHTSRDGRTFVDRINATGYAWSTIGENIAAGYSSVASVVDGWMASDGHCANLMNPNFRDVGMACAASSSSTYRTYWTMNLGRPR